MTNVESSKVMLPLSPAESTDLTQGGKLFGILTNGKKLLEVAKKGGLPVLLQAFFVVLLATSDTMGQTVAVGIVNAVMYVVAIVVNKMRDEKMQLEQAVILAQERLEIIITRHSQLETDRLQYIAELESRLYKERCQPGKCPVTLAYLTKTTGEEDSGAIMQLLSRFDNVEVQPNAN